MALRLPAGINASELQTVQRLDLYHEDPKRGYCVDAPGPPGGHLARDNPVYHVLRTADFGSNAVGPLHSWSTVGVRSA